MSAADGGAPALRVSAAACGLVLVAASLLLLVVEPTPASWAAAVLATGLAVYGLLLPLLQLLARREGRLRLLELAAVVASVALGVAASVIAVVGALGGGPHVGELAAMAAGAAALVVPTGWGLRQRLVATWPAARQAAVAGGVPVLALLLVGAAAST